MELCHSSVLAPAGSSGGLGTVCPRREGPAFPGEASLQPHFCLSWSFLEGSSQPWTLEGEAAQGQEGPLGKMTARRGAHSGQEFSGPEITASAPLHSCPWPELATPGDC